MTALQRVPRGYRLGAACVVQLALLGGVLWPQLSARVAGDEYRLAVEPVDPIDPFRGAYVVLGYPDLPQRQPSRNLPVPDARTVYVPLEQQDGTGLWQGGAPVRARPAEGPYLRCQQEWELRCGIESLFASQDDARRLEQDLADGAVATVRIDDRGNAALMGIDPADR
jgi:uncharacterized membrane-anchored protein